ncbi:hybrid sensor histidine kinase/response regulator [Paenibacillus sinopodophylli]|uniref:hybrid sensor histidine kinase/response regulator n=1 Tax=Paenibacillus sinopodophylli TaxID=1837342 RepID=UPI00110D0A1B|nr:ATP-binding protein [Paenibacillus sinopodophylli]
MNKQLAVWLGIIGLFFVVTVTFIIQWIHPSVSYPQAKDGVLDARAWNFAEEGFIPLRGEWDFYEGKLLTPDDLPIMTRDAKAVPAQVPGGWKEIEGFPNERGFGAGTYHLKIYVSKADIYSFRGKKMRMSSHIFMNNTDLGGTGKTSLSPDAFVSSNVPFVGAAHSGGETIDILIQVASFKYLEGGLVQAPEFGLDDDILNRRDHSRLADMIVVTMLLVFGLYYAGMFRQWRKEAHLMYFSFFCLATGLFFSIDNEILAMLLIPGLSFLWLQKLLFLFSYLSFIFFVLYAYSYLGEPDNIVFRWLRRCSMIYFLVFMIIPNMYLRSIFFIAIILQVVTFVTVFYAIFRSRSRGAPGSFAILLGIFFLIVSWIYAQLRYEMALDNPYYLVVTPLLLVFSQAFLISNRMQEAFKRSERLAEQLIIHDKQKDEFLAKTSHELRTPLHGIINLSQTLLDNEDKPLRLEHRENIMLLHLLGRRLSGLVHDILDMNQIRHGHLSINKTAVSLHMSVQFVMETLSISSLNRDVKIVNGLPSVLPLVFADENRLRQILHNLLENGLKYTIKGTVTISAEKRADMLAISVTDTGRGIPPQAMEELFQSFVQYEHEGIGVRSGIGLGLSISKQLVELQGGILEVESEVGEGSRFTFTIPAAIAEEEHLLEAEQAELIRNYAPILSAAASELDTSFHILIVDDEPSNLRILMDAVESIPYAYTAVHSGEEALAALQGSVKPDLVLLDIMMPGVSGLDVCREIRKLQGLAELPVLMLTASGQTGDVIASFAAGANDIVQKPFELLELKARMKSLLAMKNSSEQAVRREMDFLQAQITPHFLYNSLNALVGLSYKNVDKLREMIYHLSTYLRAKFTFVFQSEFIDLKKELELVEAYLAIEQLRFGDRLKVYYHIEDGIHVMLPPLTLQPIVENAVRHGIGQKPEGSSIHITIGRIGNGIAITVEDDGAGMDESTLRKLDNSEAGGVGIANVNRRLQVLYGGKLSLHSSPGHGTQVKLHIPEEFHAKSNDG